MLIHLCILRVSGYFLFLFLLPALFQNNPIKSSQKSDYQIMKTA